MRRDQRSVELPEREASPLDREWTSELQRTARPTMLERTKSLVAHAIEEYGEENFESAARMCEEAKTHAPRSGRIRELLGLSYYHAGKWKDAVRELLTYRRLTGTKEHNHVIADGYRAMERHDRALEVLREVSQSDVSVEIWAENVIVASSIFGDRGDYDKALAEIARAELDPREVQDHHLRLWYVRADLLERSGRDAEARRSWERIYAEDPGFHDVAERLRKLGS